MLEEVVGIARAHAKKRLSAEKEQHREGYVLWVEAATFLSVARWDR